MKPKQEIAKPGKGTGDGNKGQNTLTRACQGNGI
jgi:hypothetical protein